jgi:hypothetical protein
MRSPVERRTLSIALDGREFIDAASCLLVLRNATSTLSIATANANSSSVTSGKVAQPSGVRAVIAIASSGSRYGTPRKVARAR